MKKIIVFSVLVITLASVFSFYAFSENTKTGKEDFVLMQRAYDLYALFYEAREDDEIAPDAHITDEYTEKASEEYGFYLQRLSNNIRTRDDLMEYMKNYFTADIAEKAVKETKYLKFPDGQAMIHLDGTMAWLFVPTDKPGADPQVLELTPRLIEQNDDTVTYSVDFYYDNSTGRGSVESRTFVIRHGVNGGRICGGTFIEEAFRLEINPGTADAPVSAVCALAISAAAAVVILRKKKQKGYPV